MPGVTGKCYIISKLGAFFQSLSLRLVNCLRTAQFRLEIYKSVKVAVSEIQKMGYLEKGTRKTSGIF